MSKRSILDAGPLIALLDARDQHHRWVRERWDSIKPPLLTCEAVVVEACFLARRLVHRGPDKILQIIQRGTLDLTFSLSRETDAVVRLMKKYRGVPMSLADACLVRMSELHPSSPVLTLDRDFTIYRRNRHGRIPLLSPGVPTLGPDT